MGFGRLIHNFPCGDHSVIWLVWCAEITVQNGRYGPYLKKGTDSRSLESEEQMFTVTLDEALARFATGCKPA